MKRFLSLIFLLFFICSNLLSQNISVYIDYKKYFYVFDDGPITKLEYLPVRSFSAGGNSVAYIDNVGNFNVYYEGSAYNMLPIPPDWFVATKNIVGYYKDKVLKIVDSGKTATLSNWTTNYIVSDSLVGFYDDFSSVYKIYYQNNLTVLEGASDTGLISSYKAGSNIFAYVNFNGHFKLFYHNVIKDQETSEPASFDSGGNIVAYVEGHTGEFKVFEDGNTFTLESFKPKSYSVGNDLVSYIDNSSGFKAFYLGKTYSLLTYPPVFSETKDNLILYSEGRNFKVFYKGEVFLLEDYVPSQYKKDLSCLAYTDRNGFLKVFFEGVLKTVSTEKVNSFEVSGNVVQFYTGTDERHFYCKGQEY